MREQGSGYLARPAPSGLADVIDTILDKGVVIDAYARVSLLGVELLTIDARIAVASVDTYLRFAEATNRLDLDGKGGPTPVDLLTEGAGRAIRGVATTVVEHKVEGAIDTVKDTVENLATKAADKVGDLVEKVENIGSSDAESDPDGKESTEGRGSG